MDQAEHLWCAFVSGEPGSRPAALPEVGAAPDASPAATALQTVIEADAANAEVPELLARPPRASDTPPRGGMLPALRRGVAQLGSALGSGPRGRRFKSARPDQGFRVVIRPDPSEEPPRCVNGVSTPLAYDNRRDTT